MTTTPTAPPAEDVPSMTDEQLQHLAKLLAAYNAPGPGAVAQRWVAIIGGLIGAIGVFVGLVAWATTLQATVASMAADMADVRQGVKAVQATVTDMQVDRWTRADQARFVADELRPLEARVRALEAARRER